MSDQQADAPLAVQPEKGPLTEEEAAALDFAAEAEIDTCRLGTRDFAIRAGRALRGILERKYFLTKYASTKEYLEYRFEWSQAQAYRLVDMADVADVLVAANEKLPEHESQFRELARLKAKPGALLATWFDAQVNAHDDVPTAAEIRVSRDKVLGLKAGPKPPALPPAPPVGQPPGHPLDSPIGELEPELTPEEEQIALANALKSAKLRGMTVTDVTELQQSIHIQRVEPVPSKPLTAEEEKNALAQAMKSAKLLPKPTPTPTTPKVADAEIDENHVLVRTDSPSNLADDLLTLDLTLLAQAVALLLTGHDELDFFTLLREECEKGENGIRIGFDYPPKPRAKKTTPAKPQTKMDAVDAYEAKNPGKTEAQVAAACKCSKSTVFYTRKRRAAHA